MTTTPKRPDHSVEFYNQAVPPPTNPLATPLLTDLYQLTMAYAYWQAGRHEEHAIFDLFFRKNPFGGEYTIFAGLDEVLRFLAHYKVSDSDIEYLRRLMPTCDPGFFNWFKNIDVSTLTIYAPLEGSVCFPRVPLLRIEGPIAVAQLMESTFLCLINYASLMATNASRYRTLVGPQKVLLEFGLRRAQGPDGAMSASKYAYYGGFNATSNVLAGKHLNIEVKGTHAHAFVSSFASLDDVRHGGKDKLGNTDRPFLDIVLDLRTRLDLVHTNDGELAAFTDYALSFPSTFLGLIDTYDTLKSGILNFMLVAAALRQVGYTPVGVRLDSGDLAYLSKACRAIFVQYDSLLPELTDDKFKFANLSIVASNDINENTLSSLVLQGHSIDVFGVGTHLVTCQNQPALGCVYKLVEVKGRPRIKLSNEISKVTLPGRKKIYRLFGKDGVAMLDLLKSEDSPEPQPGERVLCRHPFIARKRAWVTPSSVERLLNCVWYQGKITTESGFARTPQEVREYVKQQLETIREDHLRMVNPTPYKVSVTEELFNKLHDLWLAETPISELS